METQALIDIILNDLKEVHNLISTFKGKSNIPSGFLQLAHKRLASIEEELSLLEDLSNTTDANINHPKEEKDEITAPHKEPSQPIFEAPKVEAPIEAPKKEEERIDEPVLTAPIEKEKPAPKKPITEATKPLEASKSSGILGEAIHTNKTSVNEKVTIKETKESAMHLGSPVSDIRKAIGINDRFYFQRELFNGKADLFNQTLDQLNQMQSYDMAVQFLQSNYTWDAEDKVVLSFLKSVKRLFI